MYACTHVRMYVVKLRVEKALEEEKLNTKSEARILQILDKELLENKEMVSMHTNIYSLLLRTTA